MMKNNDVDQDVSSSADGDATGGLMDGAGQQQQQPVFLRCVTDQTAKVGTRARFLAEIISSSTLTVTWLFNSQPVELPNAETGGVGCRYKILQEGNFYCNYFNFFLP